MAEVGLKDMDTYVSCLQNTVAQYIVNRSIMDLCLAENQRPGLSMAMRWWK